MTATQAQSRLLHTTDSCAELRTIARAALRAGIVAGVLVPRRRGGTVIPALVQSADQIGPDAFFGAPVMPQNAASVLSDVTFRPPTGRILAFLRSCEHRALIELSKLKQVDLESILVIGVDCLGATGPGPVPAELLDETSWRDLMAEGGAAPWPGTRAACAICPEPAVAAAAVTAGLIGVPRASGLILTANDEAGERLLAAVADEPGARLADPAPVIDGRAAAIAQIERDRWATRTATLAAWQEQSGSFAALNTVLAACTRCLNCRRACPLCYCRECTFETSLFETSGDRYLARAARKGAVRLPAEVMLYQLTRLAHIGLSCVSCGMCEAYCPAGIELTGLFAKMGEEARRIFAYEPGRDAQEPLPLAEYREDELEPR